MNVYSVRIGNQQDTVLMTEEEAFLVKLKYSPDCDIHNLTELHGLKAEHFHKIERAQQRGVGGWFMSRNVFASRCTKTNPVLPDTDWTPQTLLDLVDI